jgi:hypothetical protein
MTSSEEEPFCPKRVQHYHDYLQQGLPDKVFVKYRRAYIRNIAYSLQYMEYIRHTISNFPIHVVIESQLIKTFVITGSSAIESILWMLLKGNNLNKKLDWEEIQKRETNKFKDDDQDYKFEVTHYRKLENSIDIEMKFIDMCKRAEKTKMLGVESEVYSKLNHLRKLRNRIHIHSVQHDRDNDFWTFSKNDMALMASSLTSVLQSSIFAPHPNYENMFDWLSVTSIEEPNNLMQSTAEAAID